MTDRTILIDRTPIDLRIGLAEEGQVTRLFHHMSGRGDLRLGEVLEAKAGRFDPRLGGVFCEARGRPCFLPAKGGKPPGNGTTLLVEVKREAIGGKAAQIATRPVLRLPFATIAIEAEGEVKPGPLGEADEARREEALRLAAEPALVPMLLLALTPLLSGGVRDVRATSGEDAALLRRWLSPMGVTVRHDEARTLRPLLDEAEEEGLLRTVGLVGGGRLVIDETEALTAIDVDIGKGEGRSQKGAAIRAGEQALAALSRQAALRSFGGQIVLDLPRAAIRSPKIARDQVTRALSPLGRVSVPAVTGEGLVLAIAPRPRPSLLERLTEPCGDGVLPGARLAADIAAARAFRAAEAALAERRTGEVVLTCPERTVPYLEEARGDLDARFGPRLRIEQTDEEAIHAR